MLQEVDEPQSSDGGVVDNTGLETLTYMQNPNVVLISDGGGYFEILSKPPRSLVTSVWAS